MNENETVTVEFNGKDYTTQYRVESNMVIVSYLGHTKKTQLNNGQADFLAADLFMVILRKVHPT